MRWKRRKSITQESEDPSTYHFSPPKTYERVFHESGYVYTPSFLGFTQEKIYIQSGDMLRINDPNGVLPFAFTSIVDLALQGKATYDATKNIFEVWIDNSKIRVTKELFSMVFENDELEFGMMLASQGILKRVEQGLWRCGKCNAVVFNINPKVEMNFVSHYNKYHEDIYTFWKLRSLK